MTAAWIDRLEAELGREARLRVIETAGGLRLSVPKPARASASRLASLIGVDAAQWLAEEFGGESVDFPSRRGATVEGLATRLAAAVLDAGLTGASRSANDLAAEFGVTSTRVRQIRRELRRSRPPPPLPLFPDAPEQGGKALSPDPARAGGPVSAPTFRGRP